MLRIVTDGAADMPVEWGAEYDIHTIPINVQFGDKTCLQFIGLDLDRLYRMVDETRVIPKTPQPSPHQFTEFYKKIAQAEELKGTYNIVTYDSLGGSLGLGFMCRQALLDKARKMFNVKDAVLTDLSISLAVNFGPGTVGLLLYPAA